VLSWEDVGEGDELPNIVQPRYGLRDALTYQSLDHGLLAAGRDARAAGVPARLPADPAAHQLGGQRDEVHCLGYATVFLPSATMGRPVLSVLPVPHPDRPAYVPFDVHGRAGWF
jgi:hypothetical protein